MKQIFLSIILLVLVFPLVLASYNETGSNDFVLERGSFNSDRDPLTQTSVVSRSLTDSKLTPLVSDLDNDGTNEIIVLDSDKIRIYQGNTLTAKSTYDYGTAERTGNMLIFDIDGDGLKEILVPLQQTESLLVLNYSNSVLSLQNTIDLSVLSTHLAGSASSGEFAIACRDIADCVISWNEKLTGQTSAGVPLIFIQPFNATDVTGSSLLFETTTSTASQQTCFPKIRHIEVVDLTNDGDKEYIVNYHRIIGNGNDNDKYVMRAVDVTNNIPTVVWTVEEDADGVIDPSGTVSCDGTNAGKYFTPPIAFNFDTSTPTDREVLFGYMTDSNSYRLESYESDGTALDQFPEIDQGAGIIISNAFRSTSFPTGSGKEVCLVGYNDPSGEMTMICGSKTATELFESYEYTTDITTITPNYNITQDYEEYNVISHSTQQSNTLTDGLDLSEIITPYGIFSANFNTCNLLGNCDMSNIFLNGCGDSVNLAVDVEQIGSTDLLCMTDNQLTYVDDLLSNAPATITRVTYDPCIVDNVVKLNETLKVTVTVTDGEQSTIATDLVNHELTAYTGLTNEQASNEFNQSSSVGISHFFNLNQTGNNFILSITGYDNGVPASKDTLTQTYTVGSNGLTADSGNSCSFDLVAEAEAEEESLINQSLASVKADNTAVSLLQFWDDITGLGSFLGWIFLMFIAGLIVFMSPTFIGIDIRRNFPLLVGVTFFFEMLLLIIGVGIGAIGIGGLITVILLMIIAVAIGVSRMFQSSGQGL